MQKEMKWWHLKIMHHFISCISKINGTQTDNAEDLEKLPEKNKRQHVAL